jgi:Spy/CpxP family protein refolding chaperone
MKRFAVILIAVSGLLSAALVQSQTNAPAPPMGQYGGRGMTHEERMNKLSEELNLTEEQRTNVQAVFDDMRQKIQAAVEEAKSNADTQLQGILTTDQYQKLQSMWMEHQHHYEHHMSPGGAGGQ